MYVIDLTHYLDSRGAIAPQRGPARKMADFLTAVVAHASDFDRPDDTPGPVCFKCRKTNSDKRLPVIADRREHADPVDLLYVRPRTLRSPGPAHRPLPR